MSFAPNMTLLSPVLPVDRRDFPLADPTILNPVGANPLLDGEWLEFDSSQNLKRASGAGVNPAFAVFSERGRYDTQAIQKVPVLFLGPYHAQTLIFTATSIVAGSPLMVTDVTYQSLTRRGLALATSGNMIVAYAIGLIGSGASQQLQFINTGSFNLM